MMKTKRGRKLLAWLCSIAMFVGCFSGMKFVSIQSEAASTSYTGYKELTFSDFGWENQSVTGASIEGRAGLNSWDRVAFTGKVTMSGNGAEDHYMRFGSWGGMTIRSYDQGIILTNGTNTGDMTEHTNDDNNNWVYLSAGENIQNKEITLRVTFDYVNETDLKVNIFVNGANIGYGIFANRDFDSNYSLLVWAASGQTVTFASTDYEPAAATYTELTFDDFGLADQTVTNATQEGSAGLTSWDKVAFNGKVTMPGNNADDHYMRFGSWGGMTIRSYDKGMIITNGTNTGNMVENTDKDGNNWIYIGAGEDITNKQVQLRVTFDYVNESNLLVTLTINGTHSGYALFPNRDFGSNYNLLVHEQAGNAVKIESVGMYQELTFSDFGIEDQTVTNASKEGDAGLTSWDKVAFNGTLSMPGNSAEDHYMRFGSWTGMTVRSYDKGIILTGNTATGNMIENSNQDSNDWLYIDSGEDVVNKEMILRIVFEYVNDSDLKVTATINGKNSGYVIFNTRNFDSKYSLVVNEQAGNAVKIGSIVSYEEAYREFTFSDFGLEDQTVTNTSVEGRAGLAAWNKVAFVGKVTMPGNGAEDHYMRFGSWGGMTIRSYDQGIILTNGTNTGDMTEHTNDDNNNWVYLSAGENIQNKEITLRVTFDYVNETDLKVNIFVNDTNIGYGIFANRDFASDYSVLVNEQGGNAVKIGSVTDTTDEPEVSEYNELTFRDFGIDDQSITNRTVDVGTGLTSWDKIAVSGLVTMPGNGEDNHYIRFGSWGGLTIRSYNQGIILTNGTNTGSMTEHTNDDDNNWVYLSAGENIQNKEITLRVTFDHVNETDLKVQIFVNGANIGYGIFANRDFASNYNLLVHEQAGNVVKIGSTKKTEAVNDVTYDIEEKPYLLTGATVTATNQATSQVFENTGAEVNVVGDYTVAADTNGIQTSRTVSLYILGDVDLSSSATLNQDDVDALKTILGGTEASAAQKKAADLTNDGQITNTDLKLLQDIVNGTTTRDAVLDKYYPAAMRYEYLEDGTGEAVMPIVGYEGPTEALLSQEIFDGIKDAGINMISSMPFNYFGSRTAVEQALAYAENSGLGLYVRDAQTNLLTYSTSDTNLVTAQTVASETDAAKYLGKYNYFDSYLGTFVMDEPVTEAYLPYLRVSNNTHKANYAYYEEITKTLNSNANTDGHINLPAAVWFKPGSFSWLTGSTGAPYSGVTGQDLSTTNVAAYEELVKYLAENSNMNYLSYDRYAAMTDENAQECPRYMLNLDIIREQAETSDIPFWAFAPVGHWTDSGADTTELTAADMFWQINTSLAFGAKGIEYFTAVEPEIYASGDMGIYDSEGNQTQWHDDVKRANTLIAAVDDILMKSTNKGIIATGGYAATNATSVKVYSSTTSSTTRTIKAAEGYMNATTPDYTAIKSADGTSRVSGITTSGSYGALAGVFDYQGKIALYVVNYDTASARDITVNFTGISRYSVIGLASDGTVASSTSYGTSVTRNVAAGEAFLLVIEEEDLDTTTQYFDDISQYRSKDGYTAPEVDGYVFAGWYTDETAAKKDYDYTVSGAFAEEKAATLKDWNEYTLTGLGYPDDHTNGWGLKQDITSFDKLAVSGVIALPSGTDDNNGIWFMNTSAWDQSHRLVIRNAGESIALINSGFGDVTNNSDSNTNDWVVIPKSAFGLGDGDTIVGQNLKVKLTFELNGSNLRVTLNVLGTSTASAWFDMTVSDLKQLKVWVPNHKTTSGTTIQTENVLQSAYAKYVDESVLSVRAQLGANTTGESTTTSLRFITSTNSLAYQNMGFEIYVPGKGTLTSNTKKVYKSLIGKDSMGKYEYAPSQSFAENSIYFAAATINNIPNAQFDTEFTAKPFWTTMDGTKVYGVARTLTIRQGISQ